MKELLKKIFGIRNPAKNDEDIHFIEIDEEKELYLCSPLLNTECSKENCYKNGGECFRTLKKEYSQEHLLDYITNLQEENERYKKMFEAKERFSKVMPEDIDFIILSKADYDRQQEDVELTAIELKIRIDEAIEYIKEIQAFPHTNENQHRDCRELLKILQGSDE